VDLLTSIATIHRRASHQRHLVPGVVNIRHDRTWHCR
jgi:hypothetical protein